MNLISDIINSSLLFFKSWLLSPLPFPLIISYPLWIKEKQKNHVEVFYVIIGSYLAALVLCFGMKKLSYMSDVYIGPYQLHNLKFLFTLLIFLEFIDVFESKIYHYSKFIVVPFALSFFSIFATRCVYMADYKNIESKIPLYVRDGKNELYNDFGIALGMLMLFFIVVISISFIRIAKSEKDILVKIIYSIIILGFGLIGFVFLQWFQAVLWLIFFIVAYPLAIAFLGGERLSENNLVEMYKVGMKQIPIIVKLLKSKKIIPDTDIASKN